MFVLLIFLHNPLRFSWNDTRTHLNCDPRFIVDLSKIRSQVLAACVRATKIRAGWYCLSVRVLRLFAQANQTRDNRSDQMIIRPRPRQLTEELVTRLGLVWG